MLLTAVSEWLKCIKHICLTVYVLISLCPDEWRDFHDCSQDVLQPVAEGDQEAPRHVSTHP